MEMRQYCHKQYEEITCPMMWGSFNKRSGTLRRSVSVCVRSQSGLIDGLRSADWYLCDGGYKLLRIQKNINHRSWLVVKSTHTRELTMSYFQIESSRGSTVNGNALIMLYVYNGRWAIYIRPVSMWSASIRFCSKRSVVLEFFINEVKILVVFNGRLFSILLWEVDV